MLTKILGIDQKHTFNHFNLLNQPRISKTSKNIWGNRPPPEIAIFLGGYPTKGRFFRVCLRTSSKKSLKKSIFRLKNVLFQITICGHKWHKYVPGVPQNTYKPILNHLDWFKTDFKKSNSSYSKRFFKAVFGCILATFSHLGDKWEVVCRHMNK